MRVVIRIRMRNDRVLVRRLEKEGTSIGGVLLPEGDAREQRSLGEVLAVGPGEMQRDGTRREVQAKPGDRVVFMAAFANHVDVDGEEYVVIKDEDLIAVIAPGVRVELMAPRGDVLQ